MGCGDGRWLEALAAYYGCCCYGVDLDANRLSIAKSVLNQVRDINLTAIGILHFFV